MKNESAQNNKYRQRSVKSHIYSKQLENQLDESVEAIGRKMFESKNFKKKSSEKIR